MESTEINFLSNENKLKHKEYLKQLKLIYSVLEKSYPKIEGLSASEINRLNLNSEIKREAINKKCEILLHELFFDSFSDKRVRCKEIVSSYGSEANFLYEIERTLNQRCDVGFLLICVNSKGGIEFHFGRDLSNVILKTTALLAIDLWEHAYFTDYGFDRKKYIKCALSFLDLNKINDFYKSN